MKIFRNAFLLMVALVVGAAFAVERPTVNIYYLDFSQSTTDDKMVDDTIAYLKRELIQYDVKAVSCTRETLSENFKKDPSGFFISSAGDFWLNHNDGAWRIATLTTPLAPLPNESVAGVFVVRKDRDDLNSLSDLKGKTAVVTNASAFLNAQLALAELALKGYDPDSFFSSLKEVGRPMIGTLQKVASGEVDVALVRSGLLETLDSQNNPIIQQLKVIPNSEPDALIYAHSTRAYPGRTIFTGNTVNPLVARDFTQSLISIPQYELNGGQWLFGTDYSRVDDVFKSLKVGPYAYLKEWTVKRIWEDYKLICIVMLMLIGFALFHGWRNEVLVKRRTAQLVRALKKQHRLHEKVRRTNSHLEDMQKVSIVGVLSSMTAHDLLQPLSATKYLLIAMSDYLKSEQPLKKDYLVKLCERLNTTHDRSIAMIEKARDFAKRESRKQQSVDITSVFAKVIADLKESKIIAIKPLIHDLEGISVWFDPYDLEVILMNLLKNASEAAKKSEGASVIEIYGETHPNVTIVRVANSGALLTDDKIAQFTASPLKSDKPHGLGLGLSIVQSLMKLHGGSVRFLPRIGGGLIVELNFFLKADNRQ